MPLITASSSLTLGLDRAFDRVGRFVDGLFGYSPEETLAGTATMDPRLRPKVSLSAQNIDQRVLTELSKVGLKRAKLITAESNPELIHAWETMCHRAGLAKAPQLIVGESKMVNAFTLSREEVAITTGLMQTLDLRETVAVLGHELGHARHDHETPRLLAMIGFGGAGALLANWMSRAMYWREGGVTLFGSLADMFSGIIVGNIAANQVTVKPTELQADIEGAAISGDPQGLANALTKLDKHNLRGPISSFIGYMASGYPTMHERVSNLERIVQKMPAAALPPPLIVGPTAQVSAVAQNERVGQADAKLNAGV